MAGRALSQKEAGGVKPSLGKAPSRFATFCGGKSAIWVCVWGGGSRRKREGGQFALGQGQVVSRCSLHRRERPSAGWVAGLLTLASKSSRTFSMKMRGGR